MYILTKYNNILDFTETDTDSPGQSSPTNKEKNLRVVLEYPGSIEPEK